MRAQAVAWRHYLFGFRGNGRPIKNSDVIDAKVVDDEVPMGGSVRAKVKPAKFNGP